MSGLLPLSLGLAHSPAHHPRMRPCRLPHLPHPLSQEDGFASVEMPDTLPGQGYTPLHVAGNYDNYEAVQYLLSQGAMINSHDLHYATPLVSACKLLGDDRCTGKAVEILIKANADVNEAEGVRSRLASR